MTMDISTMDGKVFFSEIKRTIFGGHLTQGQVNEVNSTLEAWELLAPHCDVRFPAYALGTQLRECGSSMAPIAEIGRGRGKVYGRPAGPWGKIYYGRGKVQLTWFDNYELADRELHKAGVLKPHESMVRDPDLALRDDVASYVMVIGMMQGWFTKKKLSDFFVGDRSDWVDARTIINGHDHAGEVAGHALHFYSAIRKASNLDLAA